MLISDPEIQQALEKKETFTIHIVGVEKEADLVPLFWVSN